MRKIYLLLLSFITLFSIASEKIVKTTKPNWVNKIQHIDKTVDEDIGGYQYLLIDEQDNISKESVYRHNVVKILNSDGIQHISDISKVFDPSFQKLQFHEAKIIRNGREIDKLKDYDIQVFQRESSMERSLYDGSLTAVINLTDVRVGDIIEYSYTVIGFNPISQGNFSAAYYHQYSTPVNRIYSRVITDIQNDIQLKYYEEASEPKKVKTGNSIEYKWDVDATDYILYDVNVPPWFNIQRRVVVSTFNNWSEVVDLALPLYKYKEDAAVNLDHLLKNIKHKDKRILTIIRWVQDEVRYLGFESGIGAYKPNSPTKVFNQRYGDCKDKTLLLVYLLRKEGITAHPVWVNTMLTQALPNQLPSHRIFNHVIVYLKYGDDEIFIDPTISNQGGSLWNIATPGFKYGLLIKRGQKDLINILDEKIPSTTIKENIIVKSIGGEADLKVKTEYTHASADHMRSYFSNNSNTAIQKEYLNFYSYLYPGLEPVEDINIIDLDRNTSNKVIVTEHYRVSKFWKEEEGDPVIYCEIYPIVMESLIDYPQSSKRSMPYYLGNRNNFTQFTKVKLPESWEIEKVNMDFKGPGFIYTNVVNGNGDEVEVIHGYTVNKEFIDDSSYSEFEKKHNEILNQMSYILTYNQDYGGFKLSWISILLLVITLAIGVFFARRVYLNYDPVIAKSPLDIPIGGWLILPAIGISITPFVLIYGLITNGFFDHNFWIGAFDFEFVEALNMVLMVASELIFNVLFLVMTILVIVLFYKRRSNLPRLITILYIINFIGSLVDMIIAKQLFSDVLLDEDVNSSYREIVRSFVVGCIWIPYFNLSKRVKNTFCKLYDHQKESEVYVLDESNKDIEHNKPKSDLFL